MKEFWRRSCAKVRRLNEMTMHIEAATEVDVPALSKLLAVLFAQEAEFTPNPEAQCSGLLRIITNRDVGIVLVAKEGETVLGMVILLYTISTALGGRVALLEDMVVGPKASRRWRWVSSLAKCGCGCRSSWVPAYHAIHRSTESVVSALLQAAWVRAILHGSDAFAFGGQSIVIFLTFHPSGPATQADEFMH